MNTRSFRKRAYQKRRDFNLAFFYLIPKEVKYAAIFGFEALQNAEPSIGPWLIYREMKRSGVSVSLDGLGGDETLAGYHEYLPIAMKDAIWPMPSVSQWRDLRKILSGLYDDTFSEGSKAYLIGGSHIGEVANISEHLVKRSTMPNEILFTEGFGTVSGNVFVVSKDTPLPEVNL